MLVSNPPTCTNSGANTTDTIVISLIRMLMDGPEVSLNGSPTVSPTTAALCGSAALAAEVSFFDVLLRVIPRAACISHHDSQQNTSG